MDLTFARGDTFVFTETVTNPDGTVRDLTGATVRCSARTGWDATSTVFSVAGTVNLPLAGVATVTISPSATVNLPPLSVLVYDVELTEASGQVTTIQSGKLTVTPDVTHS